MRDNVYLKDQINQWLTNQGEKPDWGRSINPAGDFLHTTTNGFRLLILDSAIEDNTPDRIFEIIVPFLIANMHDSKQWVLDSNLRLKAE